ncbi:Putative AlphaN-acetylglucosamine transferase (AFU_orthologue; AFUA_8G02690) [Aspergillus calidoustus]|uniref:Putative AlphaN-acetylglucosamine transferase (AFU_orthologue AFUA_8G02690) n=1 Tax=Aspergillus calidoustus TaxID=454130 RepID=A0A0U5GMB2_ASPCI|nr:Putative AlphaN-acetylglucosamine transferase (AFU_orthologue; AFUA_8G02690) [Aspergillus calidoustus]
MAGNPRKGSGASEADFFDIPDEPIFAIVKRQLRRIRTWITIFVFVLFILFLRRESPPSPALPHINYDLVDWSRYAYSQYATSSPYLCNAVMVFDALERLGSRAQRVLFYPKDWDVIVESDHRRDSQLLRLAQEKYKALLIPIEVEMIKPDAGPGEPWEKSISKLLAFGEIEYERVIHLDSDILLLQNMDELFFLPHTPVAMPRAYWLLPERKILSSLLIVIEPSYRRYKTLLDAALGIQASSGGTEHESARVKYDMELLNEFYGDSALVLPHRQYGLISGEFRSENHTAFFGGEDEVWDPDKVLAEAKFVHFSDWPLPKPWVMWPHQMLGDILPKCKNNPGTLRESGCRDRTVWMQLYDDFRVKRRDVCKLLSYPAPNWPPGSDSSPKEEPLDSKPEA